MRHSKKTYTTKLQKVLTSNQLQFIQDCIEYYSFFDSRKPKQIKMFHSIIAERENANIKEINILKDSIRTLALPF